MSARFAASGQVAIVGDAVEIAVRADSLRQDAIVRHSMPVAIVAGACGDVVEIEDPVAVAVLT